MHFVQGIVSYSIHIHRQFIIFHLHHKTCLTIEKAPPRRSYHTCIHSFDTSTLVIPGIGIQHHFYGVGLRLERIQYRPAYLPIVGKMYALSEYW